MSNRIDLMDVYRDQKAREGEDCIMLFRRGAFYEAMGDDAPEVVRLAESAGAVVWVGRDRPHRIARFGAARLESVLAAIVAAGRRAAVLERVKRSEVPPGIPINRVVLPGKIGDEEHDA